MKRLLAALTFFAPFALAVDNLPIKPAEAVVSPDFKKVEVSTGLGKAPLTVQITGPANVIGLKTNTYEKFTNCGFSIQWGDGENFPGLLKRGATCAGGFEHIYAKPGLYKIVFLITETTPSDQRQVVWQGERVIKVLQ